MVRTAVILAAGSGTRRYPITRAIDKAMIPLGNRPTVDYVVEQCARGGIQHIVFVVSRVDTLIKKYYGTTISIAREYPWLEKEGNISLEYIVQKNPTGLYGTGAALLAAEHAIHTDEFVVLAADGFVHSKQDYIGEMIQKKGENCAGCVVGLLLKGDDAKNYGVIKTESNGLLRSIVEKPTNLGSTTEYPTYISYCLLNASIFPYIKDAPLESGELYLTTALENWAHDHDVCVLPVRGEYLDSGRIDSWIEANNFLRQWTSDL